MTRPLRDPPTISVLVPSYNSGPFLQEAIDSALSQSLPPYEVIVMDGASTDGSIDILRAFGDSIIWQSEPDRGQAHALNKALAEASGDVVVWLNADDRLVPGAFSIAAATYASNPELDLVHGGFGLIRADGRRLRTYRPSPYSWDRVFARGCYIFSGSIFWRLGYLRSIGGFDESLHVCMDLEILLRLKDSPARTAMIQRTLAELRIHPATKSSTIARVTRRESHAVRWRHAGGSPRLIARIYVTDILSAPVRALAPLRYSRLWSRYRHTKTL